MKSSNELILFKVSFKFPTYRIFKRKQQCRSGKNKTLKKKKLQGAGKNDRVKFPVILR